MSLGYYDSPTFLGQKDKYLMGLSMIELMISMGVAFFWFILSLLIPGGFLVRLLVTLALTGASMSILFVRIYGLSIPSYIFLSILRLFRHPSYEEGRDSVLEGDPAWLDLQLQRQDREGNPRLLGLLRRGREAASSVPDARRAEMRAEMDRQANSAAAAAEGWARDAIRSLFRGR